MRTGNAGNAGANLCQFAPNSGRGRAQLGPLRAVGAVQRRGTERGRCPPGSGRASSPVRSEQSVGAVRGGLTAQRARLLAGLTACPRLAPPSRTPSSAWRCPVRWREPRPRASGCNPRNGAAEARGAWRAADGLSWQARTGGFIGWNERTGGFRGWNARARSRCRPRRRGRRARRRRNPGTGRRRGRPRAGRWPPASRSPARRAPASPPPRA